MTEAQWLAWIRSALRSKWLRWKPRSECLNAARRPYKGPKKQQKFEYQCAICLAWFVAKQVECDHYPHDAGSILSVEDIGKFCNNLYCETDNLRCLCKACHKAYTLSQSANISLEEAFLQKRVNEFMKQPKEIILAYLKENGYSGVDTSNAKKRKELVTKLLKER